MWILQISDLHLDTSAQGGINPTEILNLLCAEVRKVVDGENPLIVVFCGDATFKGKTNNYDPVRFWFQDLAKNLPMIKAFCPCPGNHDICDTKPNAFQKFNSLSWYLTNNGNFGFSTGHTVASLEVLDTEFISVNTAYHCDHHFGKIQLEELSDALNGSPHTMKFIITHHNFIPIDPRDKSTIVNSYDAIHLALSHNVSAIFHGHNHKQTVLNIGSKSCALIGVGSLLFPPKHNLNNQFNLIRYENGNLTKAFAYRLIGDLNKPGNTANFMPVEIQIL